MSFEKLTSNILSKMPNINKKRKEFVSHLLFLFMSMTGRHNFENMARQGGLNSGTYRNNFAKDFDFPKFNIELIREVCDSELVVAFDPSFISKSGKHTAGLGYFWSGCAGKVLRGLEIGGFAAVDINNNTAMHLVAKQTVGQKQFKTILDYYSSQVISLKDDLLKVSKVLVVDAFFSKKTFVDPVVEAGFTIVSRMQSNSYLRYRYLGPKRKGSGRPTQYAGKVDVKNPNPEHFKPIIKEENMIAYEGVVHIRSLKRWTKVVLVHVLGKNGKVERVNIFFSTDAQMEGTDIIVNYKGRFQVEFLFRDAKQFTGLEECQSRNKERLDFHFNASLTAVSIAKALHHLSVPLHKRNPFSMSSIKTQYFNELLMDRIFSTFGLSPKIKKNDPKYNSIRNFGAIAA